MSLILFVLLFSFLFFLPSWMVIFKELIFALVELSQGFEFFQSPDPYSNTIIQLLFVAYVAVNLTVVVNMLIALLSNTYRRVQV